MVKRIPFNDLPASVRDRLWKLLGSEGRDDAVVKWWPGHRGYPIVLAVFGVIGLVVAAGFLQYLLKTGTYYDPYYNRESYAGIAGVLTFAGWFILPLVYRFIWKPPPHKWGVKFLTGGYAVFVGRDFIEVLPFMGMDKPTLTKHLRNGHYQYTTLTFNVGGRGISNMNFNYTFNRQQDAEDTVGKLFEARAIFEGKVKGGDHAGLRDIDPFAACTISGQWSQPSDEGPKVSGPPPMARRAKWLAPMVFGALVGGGLYLGLSSYCDNTPTCDSMKRSR